MKIELLNYSLQNIGERKLRSFLTVLSILIGITAIFALVSFGMGISSYVDELAEEAGSDKLFIYSKGMGAPGTDANFYISEDELRFIEKIRGVDKVVGMYMGAGEIEHDDKRVYNFLMGLNPDDQEFIDEMFTVGVSAGRHLKSGELRKVLLGYNYQLDNKVFERGIKDRDKVLLNGEEFEVVGFYGEVGNAQDDQNIYITLEAFEELFPESKGKYGYVMLNAEKGQDPAELADKITERLRKYKNQDAGEEDFYVQTFTDVIETFGVIIGVINGVLYLIALISVVVASVNIMNTMYTAVIERTKEIGIMKAIGAKNNEILLVFIAESGFLGMIGGGLGIFLGWVVASIGGMVAANAGYSALQPVFPWYLILGCLLFSFFVGAGSGVMPARAAARQKPVDALRYE